MTPPASGSGASDSTQDVLVKLSTWMGSVLDDILRVMADVEAGPVMMTEMGWQGAPPALPAALLSRINQQAAGGTSPGARASETFGEVLVAVTALGEAIISDAQSGGGGVGALELVADLFDITLMLRMREEKPALWAILRLLNLISDDGVQLANLSNLVSDTHQYLTGLVSGPGYAQAFQDYSAAILASIGTGLSFLPGTKQVHGHDKTSFRSEVLYGWAPAGPTDHPNLMQILERTLTWRLNGQAASSPDGTPAAEQTIDLTFALVPAEQNLGKWGLLVRLSGATAFTIPLGAPTGDPPTPTGWQLTFAATDGGAVDMLFGANGQVWGSTEGFTASIALERPDDVSGSWVIPKPPAAPAAPPTGAGATPPSPNSHVEIQHLRAALTFSENNGPVLDIGAHADHVIIDIELGSDSFLRAVLPQSVRIDSNIGLGVDTRRGFYLNGGVALIVDLPVNVTIGPAAVLDIQLQALHLRLGFGTADNSAVTVGLTVDAAVQVAGGIFAATVAGVGASFQVTQVPDSSTPGAAGHWQPALKAIPPNGLGLVIKAGPVTGGGYIGFDADRGEYTGALQLAIGLGPAQVSITALGMLDTKIPEHDGDWALILILAAQFNIQLGAGFFWTGLGGVLGVNHTLDSDAIAAGLRTKSLDSILFPPDPVAQAPHIFATWRQTMPIAVGHTIVGPMVQVAWGGVVKICTLEIAVLLEITSDPFGLAQIVLLGSFQFSAPLPEIPLVRLRADVLGRLKFNPLDFLLQAELVDSRLGTFTVSGGLVIVARGGPDAAFVLSVGGFHPHFTPPANVPVADRIRVDISGTDNPRLRLEAYVALTSQSFQFGARVELHAAAGPLALDGWLGLDVLIQWLPHFRFSAEISAGLSLSYDGSPVLAISIDVLLEGPGPWHVKGYASLTLLFFTLSIPVDASWGDDAGPTAQIAQPVTLVHDALSSADAWSAALPAGTSSIVVLRAPTGPVVPAHPLATVSCHQRVAPLGMSITHVGNQPLAAPTTVDVTTLLLGGAAAPDTASVTDAFAAGQFLTLTDDQALSRPSFEGMRSGVSAGSSTVATGNATVVATTYKTIHVDGDTVTKAPRRWLLALDHADAVLRPAAPRQARPSPASMSLTSDTLRTVSGSTTGTTTFTLAAAQLAGKPATTRLLDAVGVAGGVS